MHWLTKTRFDIALAVGVCSCCTNPPRRPTSKQPRHFPLCEASFLTQPLLHSGGSKSAHGLLRRRLRPNDLNSTSARIFLFGSTPMSLRSWKQSSTSHSTCEAKHRFLASCTWEAIWIQSLLQEMLNKSAKSNHPSLRQPQCHKDYKQSSFFMRRLNTLRQIGILLD